jgi:ribose transport system substrate-binding protein
VQKRFVLAILATVLAVAATGCGGGDGGDGGGEAGGEGQETYDITLLQGVKGDEFYVTMACGVEAAAKEHGARVSVQGPDEFDASQQIPILNGIIAEKPDALLIAPTDTKALIAPMQQAKDAGITVIEVDTIVEKDDISVSKIATDNVEGGRVAARALVELIGEEGSVLVVNVKPGISTTDQRQQGFEEEIKKHPEIEYLGTEFSNNEPARAASIVSATLAADPDLRGIFGTNLFSAEGSATGLRNAGKQEQVRIVGFDAGPAQVKQLEENLVQALVAQKPYDIGFQGVEQAIASLEGGDVEEAIKTDLVTVTQDNVDDPEIREDVLYRAEC